MIILQTANIYVLIDTQWNVKDEIQVSVDDVNEVLIDTQWNVKQIEVTATSVYNSFNRYIVECKGATYQTGLLRLIRF